MHTILPVMLFSINLLSEPFKPCSCNRNSSLTLILGLKQSSNTAMAARDPDPILHAKSSKHWLKRSGQATFMKETSMHSAMRVDGEEVYSP